MVLAEALGETSSARGSRSTRPTSTRRRSPRRAAPSTRATAARGRARRVLERYFEPRRPALRLPQGAAARGHLRPQRPHPGRADLAHRPARVPQHAHVLQHRDAGADPRALPLRAARRRLPVARQVRDAALARRLFEPVDLKRRVFREGAGTRPARRPSRSPSPRDAGRRGRRPTIARSAERRSSIGPIAQLVVDARRPRSSLANDAGAARCSAVAQRDIGRPLQDLEISYRPVDLRSPIERATPSDAIARRDVEWTTSTATGAISTSQVAPLIASEGERRSARAIAFHDVTRYRHAAGRARERPSASSRRRTRSCSRRSRSSRRPTRSSSRPTRSSRRPTRSSSRPTRSSRR